MREQVASLNQTRPTRQSQAAARELQKLERNGSADEIDLPLAENRVRIDAILIAANYRTDDIG
ncbi:MAG TPA: hypothetical protein VGU20_31265 [Stellaceae bacterium]|nr:hypothetical protein [Stellaceae bacterium]